MTNIADTLLIKGPLMISYCQNSFKIIFIYYYYYYVFPCVPHILFVSCHKKESRTPHSNKTNIYLMMMTRYHIWHNVVLKIYNISSFPVWTFWITLLPSFFFFKRLAWLPQQWMSVLDFKRERVEAGTETATGNTDRNKEQCRKSSVKGGSPTRDSRERGQVNTSRAGKLWQKER